MEKSRKLPVSNRITIIVEGPWVPGKSRLINVEPDLLERIRNARSLYKDFSIDVPFIFKTVNEAKDETIIAHASGIHELN